MSRELFIYWRAARADAALARTAAREMQAGLLLQHQFLVAGLYQRADESGDHVTLMETYRLPGGIGAELQALLEAAAAGAVQGLCQGQRHVEVFEHLA